MLRALTRRDSDWRAAYPDLHAFCLFIGYPKSGHSLVGALLDAHPDVVIGKALNAFGMVVVDESPPGEVVEQLLENSRYQATRGRKQNRYRYGVENQWQGRIRTLRVLGDKFSDRTTKRIGRTSDALARFEREMGLPLRLIHVTRNPFDMVARIAVSKIADGTEQERVAKATDYIGRLAAINQDVIEEGAHPVLTFGHETMVADPREQLGRLCRFLGVEADDGYVDDCAEIVFPAPQRARGLIDWQADQIEAIEQIAARHDFLREYRLDEPE
jgi:hypothetical protein